MADEWHVVGFGKIKSNRKVICIRYVTKSQETRVSVLSIKSWASTSEGGEGHRNNRGSSHPERTASPSLLSFLLLSPSLPHLSFLSQLSGFLSPQIIWYVSYLRRLDSITHSVFLKLCYILVPEPIITMKQVDFRPNCTGKWHFAFLLALWREHILLQLLYF